MKTEFLRYFFHIAYKGAAYHGWQRQVDVISVQQKLEETLFKIVGVKRPIIGCGRTDAGVHASQYFFHVDYQVELPQELKFILNKNLPSDITVFDILKYERNYHAQFDLATLYDMGAGVRQDLGQAAYWYRRAAAQGAPAGQYNMAVMLEDGVGVDRDYPDSYFWYDQALQRDFFDIRGSSRERVSAKMTMAEILSTQRRSRNWQPVRE